MKDPLLARIEALRKDRRAVILAHNYQPPEIQDVADMRGDSLELSRLAAETDAGVIVFCGVHFMAETAAILNPEKTVLLPRLEAGCPMADQITPQDVRAIRVRHPGVPVVTYVNSTAAVKAESDVCCTSANVVAVVNSLDAPEVYLAPDRNLARYAASHTKKRVYWWDGYCPVHDGLTAEHVTAAREAHPGAVLLAHPECRPEVLALADVVASTSGMLRHARESAATRFLVGTEAGILHTMRRENPEKEFFPVSNAMICPDMKRISLSDVAASLETLAPRVTVPEAVRLRALSAVTRMLAVA